MYLSVDVDGMISGIKGSTQVKLCALRTRLDSMLSLRQKPEIIFLPQGFALLQVFPVSFGNEGCFSNQSKMCSERIDQGQKNRAGKLLSEID